MITNSVDPIVAGIFTSVCSDFIRTPEHLIAFNRRLQTAIEERGDLSLATELAQIKQDVNRVFHRSRQEGVTT